MRQEMRVFFFLKIAIQLVCPLYNYFLTTAILYLRELPQIF